MMKTVSQSGSAILWVLIGVALVSAIGVSMMNSSRPSTETITDQAGKARAAQAQDYSNAVNAAVKRLKLRGCADDEISYETPNGNSSNPNAPDDESCHVFRTAGGQVQFIGSDTTASEKRVFVTSTVYTGALGGLAGANAKCAERASAAGLNGVFKAWISDSTSSPATSFTQSATPYVLVDGTEIATDWADLTDGTSLNAAINIDEYGDPGSGSNLVWTNTTPNGTPVQSEGQSCENWTAVVGGTIMAGARISATTHWTSGGLGLTSCTQLHHLYCFQQ